MYFGPGGGGLEGTVESSGPSGSCEMAQGAMEVWHASGRGSWQLEYDHRPPPRVTNLAPR